MSMLRQRAGRIMNDLTGRLGTSRHSSLYVGASRCRLLDADTNVTVMVTRFGVLLLLTDSLC
jgi:hypothetical protein